MSSRPQWEELLERSNLLGVQFVLAELNMTLSMLDSADLHPDAKQRYLAREGVRHAGETISRCQPHLTLTDAQEIEISAKVREIDRRLPSVS